MKARKHHHQILELKLLPMLPIFLRTQTRFLTIGGSALTCLYKGVRKHAKLAGPFKMQERHRIPLKSMRQ